MATFVFSNRSIQVLLDKLAGVLSPEQHTRLVARLNHVKEQRLDAMWEAVFLGSLAHESSFLHEEIVGERSRPDFQFAIAAPHGNLSIVGDVTAVSDKGLDEVNPIDWIREQIFEMAERAGLDPNCFNTDVSGGVKGEWPNLKTRLHLGKKKALNEMLQKELRPFIKALARSSDAPREFRPSDMAIGLTVRYVPNQWGSSGGHVSYDVIHSPTENHVFNALKSKAAQLRGALDDAIRLVVLCDNDCAAMHSQMGMGVRAVQIAQEFLNGTDAVDCVLLVAVKQKSPGTPNYRDVELDFQFVRSLNSPRLSNANTKAVFDFLKRVVAHFPSPIQDPCNARIRALSGQFDSFAGTYRTSETMVTLSVRAIQELLAGKHTREEFNKLFRWHDGDKPLEGPDELTIYPNPFAQHLKEGQLIISAKVIEGGDSDDHMLEFNFGPPDAGASKFR